MSEAVAPRRIDTPYGEVAAFPDDLISEHLERFGEWAPYEGLIARSLLRDGGTVVDGGAFLGTFGLSLLMGTSVRVHAVEANPDTIPLLRDNAERLGDGRVSVHHGALGLPPGGATGLSAPDGNRGGTTLESDTETPKATIPALTLDDLRATLGDYGLAKLDLEGCELRALRQDQSYLHRAKPILLVEANDDPATCQVANYCRWLGYEVTYGSLPVWRTSNPKGATEPIFALAHEGLLIATPPGTEVSSPPGLVKDGGRLIPVPDAHTLIEALWQTPRWSTQAWMTMERERLIAVLGRLDRGDTRKEFQRRLYPDTPFGEAKSA